MVEHKFRVGDVVRISKDFGVKHPNIYRMTYYKDNPPFVIEAVYRDCDGDIICSLRPLSNSHAILENRYQYAFELDQFLTQARRSRDDKEEADTVAL